MQQKDGAKKVKPLEALGTKEAKEKRNGTNSARQPWLLLQWACHSAGGCDGCAKAQPRGATPHPRSGAEAGRTPCPKGGGQEELPHVRGQGQRPRVPDFDGTGTAERSYPASDV